MKNFLEIKVEIEEFYKALEPAYCPYFKELIIFNSKGLEHLKFNSRNHARPQEQQLTRFKLFQLAPEVIKLSRTIQGILHTKNFEWTRTNSRTELVLKPVSYYEFIAILKEKRVRVVIKQIDASPKYFWSIIPFWKKGRVRRERFMHSNNLEED